jgi:hypothetical protein
MSVDVEREPFSVPEIWAGGLALATVVLIAFGCLRIAEPQNAVPTPTRYASVSIQSEALAKSSIERPRVSSNVAGATPDVRSTYTRLGTGNATPIASNDALAPRPPAADRTAPAEEAVGLRKQQDGMETDAPSVLSDAIWGPPSLRDARLAESQRRNVADPRGVGAGTFIGGWTDDIGRCRTGRKAPVVISSRAAKTAVSECDFRLVTREAANRWRVTATCAAGGKSWRANIALKLIEPNLTWSSERGTAIYVRCRG